MFDTPLTGKSVAGHPLLFSVWALLTVLGVVTVWKNDWRS